MQDHHRTIFHKPKGRGRTGSHRTVLSVDTNRADGYAFIGDFINPEVQVDLPVGTLIVRQTPIGSHTHPSTTWAYALTPPPGEAWDWSQEFERSFFLDFRDMIAGMTNDTPPSTNREPTNGAVATAEKDPADTNHLQIHVRRTPADPDTWNAQCDVLVNADVSMSYHSFRTSNLSRSFFCPNCMYTLGA